MIACRSAMARPPRPSPSHQKHPPIRASRLVSGSGNAVSGDAELPALQAEAERLGVLRQGPLWGIGHHLPSGSISAGGDRCDDGTPKYQRCILMRRKWLRLAQGVFIWALKHPHGPLNTLPG